MKHSGALLIAAILVLSSNGLPMAQDNRPAAPSALPREIQADRFLLKARKSYTKKDWKTASEFFAKIQNIETEIPHTFHYFYVKTLRNQRDLVATKHQIHSYLHNARRDVKYSRSIQISPDNYDYYCPKEVYENYYKYYTDEVRLSIGRSKYIFIK